jgi:hypothetical protein
MHFLGKISGCHPAATKLMEQRVQNVDHGHRGMMGLKFLMGHR